ncbi:cupin domain-containing protein [Falsochrobactrum sp. TDYN1]|uniref:Cupin domain-containing protein n=1 Tax=Falsochrobactrum tianjinense TaxID=2706015 RepID=A0A949PU57_9HYPH|nr:cupin domain-containing protein [Falsochrobactrum sp. TDYN1]MBV2144965.1 cupin domain-containing protein [Falsochrobactrum sp. TDYN1]
MSLMAISQVQLDDQRLRVTLWSFPAGAETGWHRHEHDYVVVPVKGGILTVEDSSGRRSYPIETGKSYTRKIGVEHNILNETLEEIAFVEIELKEGC